MIKHHHLIALCALLCQTFLLSGQAIVSTDSVQYNEVKTYLNPILPGDHPDPTLLHIGDDFFHCGSSFHFTPYLPIYHSTDLMHWEVISRVLMPADASAITDRPSAGIWQGALTYFYGSYWIYFSSNGQWFSKAASPYGPWSRPEMVRSNTTTGPLGYDNSIFVDDDGKPYMVIKNGQKVNRVQALGKDGQLTDTVINLDWINAKLQYSWAEGPVMCKRNGFYYYFPAGDVSGGQYVLRGTALTADSTKWERLGEFFKPVTDPKTGFRRPNHMSAPIQIKDGSWWTIAQSYEKYADDDWSGMGRQTSLYPISWEGDRPWGMAPTSLPIPRPNLPLSNILWRSMQTDNFLSDTLNFCWHFLSRKNAAKYSLVARKGWLRLSPDSGRTSIVQKETDHYYSAVTKVELNAQDSGTRAGLYLSNGNQQVMMRLFTGYDGAQKIVLQFDTATRSIRNPFGKTVWLKIVRNWHALQAYCSGDGRKWLSLGAPISAVQLDKVQPNYNSWVGTSVGLFAEGKPADFDFFICKDGFTPMPAIGYSNAFGVARVEEQGRPAVTTASDKGGWLMLSGVELGHSHKAASRLQLDVLAVQAGTLEIWLDDLRHGKRLASIAVKPILSRNKWITYRKDFPPVSGHHDIFIKFAAGVSRQQFVNSLTFIASE